MGDGWDVYMYGIGHLDLLVGFEVGDGFGAYPRFVSRTGYRPLLDIIIS